MSWFHRHQWVERERIYAPSPRRPESGGIKYDGPAGNLQQIMFGVTTILYTCGDPACRKPRTVKVLGDARKDKERRDVG